MKDSIILLGTNFSETSIHCLSRLVFEKHTIVAVITRRKSNFLFHWLKERIILLFTSKKSLEDVAKKTSVPYFVVEDLNSESSEELIKSLQPSLICSCIFDQILKKNIIDIPEYGAINIHPALLPKNRGPDPYFWTIRNRDTETGVTVHYMDEGIDTGDIIAQKACPVPDGITIPELHNRLSELTGDLLISGVHAIFSGTVEKTQQGPGTRYPAPGESDYCIDITRDAKYIFDFVKAVRETGPGPILEINNQRYYITNAIDYKIVPDNGGAVVQNANGIISVVASDGIVTLSGESTPQKLLRLLGLKKIFGFSGNKKNSFRNQIVPRKTPKTDIIPETRMS